VRACQGLGFGQRSKCVVNPGNQTVGRGASE
jgi:hypothetical protein